MARAHRAEVTSQIPCTQSQTLEQKANFCGVKTPAAGENIQQLHKHLYPDAISSLLMLSLWQELMQGALWADPDVTV